MNTIDLIEVHVTGRGNKESPVYLLGSGPASDQPLTNLAIWKSFLAQFIRENSNDDEVYFPKGQENKLLSDFDTRFFVLYDVDLQEPPYDPQPKNILAVSSFKEITSHTVEMSKTIVRKDCRGKGYGNLICKLLDERIKHLGFKKIITNIFAGNIAMLVLRLEMGYKIEGFHPNHWETGKDEYSLGKEL